MKNEKKKKKLSKKVLEKRKETKKIRSVEELEVYFKKHRSEDMLTVQDLIDWLQKQNPKACVLGFEPNSNAWIEQHKKLPSISIKTVREAKEQERKSMNSWYRHDPDDVRQQKVEAHMKEVFRYAEDDDVVIRF